MKPVTQVLRKVKAKAVKVAVPVNAAPTAAEVLKAAAAKVRALWREGKVGQAGWTMAAHVNAGDRAGRQEALKLIASLEESSAISRQRREANAMLRAKIVEGAAADWVRSHGFDPRFESEPKAPRAVYAAPAMQSAKVVRLPGTLDASEASTVPEMPAVVVATVKATPSAVNALASKMAVTEMAVRKVEAVPFNEADVSALKRDVETGRLKEDEAVTLAKIFSYL